MSDERDRILRMLADGKITADEAGELLDAIDHLSEKEAKSFSQKKGNSSGIDAKKPKFLRIMVEPKENGKGEKVNIRIPLSMLRAGVKLASIVPGGAKDKINDKMKAKGIDINLNNLDSKSLDEIIGSLGSMSIDVDDDKEKVKIFCE
ncbi:MAG: hypothetical protein DRP51_08130 [Candidatus Zixiibacteriota bacterium]|nr:MAG: hypothetical protein DRP51_08130 [candidate division Zixibacteria bacterium]